MYNRWEEDKTERGQQNNPVLAQDGIVGKPEGLALHRKEGILPFGPGGQREECTQRDRYFRVNT